MISPMFIHINLPYGIKKNRYGGWHAFNRKYLPLGIKERVDLGKGNTVLPQDEYDKLFIGTPYNGLTEAVLVKLAVNRIERDNEDNITCIWLYRSADIDKTDHLNEYFDKLKILAKLKIGKVRISNTN
jgi:hypothetical protein